MRRLLLLALLLPALARADVLTTRRAVLASAQAVAGASAHQVEAGVNWQSLYLCGVETGATTWSVEQSVDGGASWQTVSIGVTPLVFADVNACVWIPQPAGRYRTFIACVACTFTATALAGPEG